MRPERQASPGVCGQAWESLLGDPLPWLLDQHRPNLHWRALLELVRRPPNSPAVVRARRGANVVEPLASLLVDLHPDGSWVGDPQLWRRYSGSGWRLLAAVQWGADPSDPRLQAASEALLEGAPGASGLSRREGGPELPWLTARALSALARLGWCRHPRFLEALAWLDEGAGVQADGGWQVVDRRSDSRECAVTAVALLDVLTECGERRRQELRSRAVESLLRTLAGPDRRGSQLGHPNLARTDDAEILSTLARAFVPLQAGMVGALARVQRRQIDGGRWLRQVAVPRSLRVSGVARVGEPSRWVSLECVVALMTYAADAQLPRMYPPKPSKGEDVQVSNVE